VYIVLITVGPSRRASTSPRGHVLRVFPFDPPFSGTPLIPPSISCHFFYSKLVQNKTAQLFSVHTLLVLHVHSLPAHCLFIPTRFQFGDFLQKKVTQNWSKTAQLFSVHTAGSTRPFTAYSLPIHCLLTAYSFQPVCNLWQFLGNYFTQNCSKFSPYTHCLFYTSIHCSFTAYSLLIHCLFTAYSLPIHCLFTAYSFQPVCNLW
jgi:hypothetical protein